MSGLIFGLAIIGAVAIIFIAALTITAIIKLGEEVDEIRIRIEQLEKKLGKKK